MAKSIVQADKKCFVCGTTMNLHKHHIFFGPNRKLSEQYGLTCYLCLEHHETGYLAVHNNRKMDLKIKRIAQERFQEKYPDLDFLGIFGRNYL